MLEHIKCIVSSIAISCHMARFLKKGKSGYNLYLYVLLTQLSLKTGNDMSFEDFLSKFCGVTEHQL